MNNYDLYKNTSFELSKQITNRYSTSFSIGTQLLDKNIRPHIYAIYGFVRLADEIVDTFHQHDKKKLLDEFVEDTYLAIERKISTNPVLHAFQHTVNQFDIDKSLIDAFLNSMYMDLEKNVHDEKSFEQYIYGSAEVVGLMCLKVFVNGDQQLYEKLLTPARALGSAFQKVNFLRDVGHDFYDLGRIYFPDIDFNRLSTADIDFIFDNIQKDFDLALKGIKTLPAGCKTGVYVAYVYYYNLFKKLKMNKEQLLKKRIRINNLRKFALMIKAWMECNFMKTVTHE